MRKANFLLLFNSQLNSSHRTLNDAIRFGRERQKKDYKARGEALRFTVVDQGKGLLHEEEGYNKQSEENA